MPVAAHDSLNSEILSKLHFAVDVELVEYLTISQSSECLSGGAVSGRTAEVRSGES